MAREIQCAERVLGSGVSLVGQCTQALRCRWFLIPMVDFHAEPRGGLLIILLDPLSLVVHHAYFALRRLVAARVGCYRVDASLICFFPFLQRSRRRTSNHAQPQKAAHRPRGAPS